MTKYPKYKNAVEAVWLAIKQNDGTAVDKAIQQLYSAQEEEMPKGCSDAEGVFLQFSGMAAAIDNHLRQGDHFSARFHFVELQRHYEEMCAMSPFTDEEIYPIKQLLRQTAEHLKSVLLHELHSEDNVYSHPNQEKIIKKKECRKIGSCSLCKEQDAICTGSHLAPHFLIQPFLSYNGTSQRDTEVINETIMAGYQKERKWGRSVPEDKIDEIFGIVPTDEKETIKKSAVTRDYLFCNFCEKRFGYIETAYSESFRKKQPCTNGTLAYVFWLGVFWRLSVGKMAIQLNKKDEETIGQLLNQVMPYDIKSAKKMVIPEGVKTYSYSIYHCSNTKGELSGVIGMHSDNAPYWLLLGDFVAILYNKEEQTIIGHVINDYHHEEQWQEISFIDYWKMKQRILDANAAYEIRHMGDDKEKIVDIVKGDHIEKMPSLLFGSNVQELTTDEIKGHTNYQLKIPGSLCKIMTLCEQHPEISLPEERIAFIEKELGYTYEEVQEMFDYWNEHIKIHQVRNVSKKVKRSKKNEQKQRPKAKRKKKNKKKRK